MRGPAGGHQDARYLARLIQRRAGSRPSTSCPRCSRSFWRSRRLRALPRLRRVICSGEALLPELVRRFFERLPKARSCTTSTVRPRPRWTSTCWACSRRATPGAACRSAGRSPTPTLRARPRAAAGAGGVPGELLHRRRRAGPRLPRPPGADRRALRPRPVRRRAGRAALPHRRPRAAAPRRRDRVPGPARPPGQDPRLPHRAGRDRGGAARPPGVRERRGRRARRRPGASAWWPTWWAPTASRRPTPCARTCGAACPSTWCPALRRPAALPLTPNGKVDRRALPDPAAATPAAGAQLRRARCRERWSPGSGRRCWASRASASTTTSSTSAATRCCCVQVQRRLRGAHRPRGADRRPLPLPDDRRARRVPRRGADETRAGRPRRAGSRARRRVRDAIAIVGMAGRFPGAGDVDEFWRNLCAGVEPILFFTDDELLAAGVDPQLLADPPTCARAACSTASTCSTPAFFGYRRARRELMDPQQRLFLECAWEALEDAGYDPARYPAAIGVFAGVGDEHLHLERLRRPGAGARGRRLSGLARQRQGLPADPRLLQARPRGPERHRADRLLDLAGGRPPGLPEPCSPASATWRWPAASRSLPAASAATSTRRAASSRPTATAAPSTRSARGTVAGSGVGVVVLKRLDDALRRRRHASTRSSAARRSTTTARGKVGFTAPSVDGQARGDRRGAAPRRGSTRPRIGYVEAHGTGTPLGDPIEVAALTQAFRAGTAGRGFCALGSVKTNIGHLDAAAGVAGLIKTVLALEHRQLPPSLHFAPPNPEIDFADSPFYVNARLREWPARRRAAARRRQLLRHRRHQRARGARGGAGAREAADRAAQPRAWQLLLLSARTADGARGGDRPARRAPRGAPGPRPGRRRLHAAGGPPRLRAPPRRRLPRAATRRSPPCARATPSACSTHAAPRDARRGRPVAFLFPGQGAQHAGMGAALYADRAGLPRRARRLLRALRPRARARPARAPPRPGDDAAGGGRGAARAPTLTQPALFAVEYALAALWMSWGVRPDAMIGHSVGEYVAACLAGVFTLDDALRLVAARGRLMGAAARAPCWRCRWPRRKSRALLAERREPGARRASTRPGSAWSPVRRERSARCERELRGARRRARGACTPRTPSTPR